MAKFLQGYKLPPEIALMPNSPFFREGDNQLMPTLFVGHAQAKGAADPEDLFAVDIQSKGAEVALSGRRDRMQDEVGRRRMTQVILFNICNGPDQPARSRR